MKIQIAQIFLLMVCLAASIHAQTFEGNSKDIDQILKNIDAFSTYYMNLDYDRIADSYSKDAKILPPGTDIIKGRKAIKKIWIVPEGVKIMHHKITPLEIKIIGKYAYDIGYYEGKTKQKDGKEVSWKGKYLIIWRKEDKQWKIYADSWNRVG